jgi:hypothetical protein
VVHVYPGAALATVDSFIGLLSPTRQTYDVSFAGDVPLTELDARAASFSGNPATVMLGRPTRVQSLTIDTWALHGFLAESTVAYSAPITGSLRLDNGNLRLRVTNQGQDLLHDVGAVRGNIAYHLGDLAPGQSAELNTAFYGSGGLETAIETLLPGANVSNYGYIFATGSSAEQRALNRRVSVLAMALQELEPGTVTLVGWGGPAPLVPQIPGHTAAHDDLTLVLADLPVPVGAELPTVPTPEPTTTGGVPFIPPPLATAPSLPTETPVATETPVPTETPAPLSRAGGVHGH